MKRLISPLKNHYRGPFARLLILLSISLAGLSFARCFDSYIFLSKSECDQPGRQVPNGEIPTPQDVALDAFCAAVVQERSAPNGFITIFGSARAKEELASYQITYSFAKLWTEKYGSQYPILTGGGPGIMEAGNRGAKEAKGPSLGYSSYFGKEGEAPGEPMNSYTTDGYIFASFSQREAEMVDRAAAIIVAAGGFGTEWEIFETLSKVQTGKKRRVPVLLLGERQVWTTLLDRIEHLRKIKTISPSDPDIIQLAPTPEKAVEILASSLNLS